MAFTVMAACGPRVDLAREAAGVRWDKLSGRVTYARWDQAESSDPRGIIFLLDAPARKLSVVRNALTTGKAPSFESTGWVREVAFKPGASVITFTVLSDTLHWEMRTLDLDSKLEQVLFPDSNAHHNFPVWSPNGRLAYNANGPDGVHLLVDGQFVLSYPNPSRVAWESSSRVITSLPDATSPGGLYLVDPQTQSLTAIVSGTDIFEDPAIDAGRRRLAYVRRGPSTGGLAEIWVANIDGTNQTRATHGYADYNPAWSADGGAVLFARFHAGLFSYEIASGSITQVTQMHADAMAWSP